DLHRAHGVDLRTGASVQGFTGEDGRVTGVLADGAELGADLVVVGVGASPRTRLAAGAGLELDQGGIVVDEYLRSSDAHVLAAGDVALAQNTRLGARLRVEHWDNAIRQGRLAARTILARDDTYDWLPYFFTDQFDLGMEYVGRSGPDDEVVLRGDPASGEFVAFWLDRGRVSAAMNVNVWDVNDVLRELVGRDIDPARLADPAVPLSAL
ncbi:MAG: FAD-dependent oxidoreductase, partial [Actinomycetota bacterium]|nr:FAD-dependent oxidoreductase [Actinomycetota bacterium]